MLLEAVDAEFLFRVIESAHRLSIIIPPKIGWLDALQVVAKQDTFAC